MQQADREVGEREHDRAVEPTLEVVERLRHREREHEHRGHRAEHRDPTEPSSARTTLPEPGVADPAPPQQRQHEQAAHEPAHREVVGHQGRDLREREHEDEVEEELDRRDPGLLGDRLDARMLASLTVASSHGC